MVLPANSKQANKMHSNNTGLLHWSLDLLSAMTMRELAHNSCGSGDTNDV